MSDVVLKEQHGQVVLLRLNRPEARNAIDLKMADRLDRLVGLAAGDDHVRVLVLSSSDQRAFCSGMDAREAVTTGSATADRLNDLFWAFEEYPKPLVAAVPGYVYGAGAEIALSADVRIGDEGTRFCFPGTSLGLATGAWHLVESVGAAWAKELVITGREVGADEAVRIGLLHELDPDPEARALDRAQRIAQRSLSALVETKRLFMEAPARPLKARFEDERTFNAAALSHGESHDRLSARFKPPVSYEE